MAGGGGVPRRPGLSLAERAALSAGTAPVRRHCWVEGPAESPGPWPGLVVEWRRDGSGWSARTVYVVTEGDAGVVVEQWLPAVRLRPAL